MVALRYAVFACREQWYHEQMRIPLKNMHIHSANGLAIGAAVLYWLDSYFGRIGSEKDHQADQVIMVR